MFTIILHCIYFCFIGGLGIIGAETVIVHSFYFSLVLHELWRVDILVGQCILRISRHRGGQHWSFMIPLGNGTLSINGGGDLVIYLKLSIFVDT